nr:tetratricopeptide repeat protein [Pseudenhygromyxa sp. WMMC2535]
MLGRGAMGVVYDAWDPTLERRVALKLLRTPSKRAVERLLREARALARFDHPGVVRIWAADVHRGAVYIAMELIEGVNLRQWLAPQRDWREILSVLMGAGHGLAAAHAAGVVHRDFKPENVLVGADGQARVLDFGIARVKGGALEGSVDWTVDGDVELEGGCASSGLSGSFVGGGEQADAQPLTEAGAVVGTLLYMAPEQHASRPIDERADQFAFCVTLFEAIYGVHPFPARTREELAAKVMEGELAMPANHLDKAPRWLERVILRGLSPDREARFESMDALLEALARYPGRRRRRLRWLGAGALAAAALTLGLLLPSGDDAPGPCVDVSAELEPGTIIAADTREALVARFSSVPRAWAPLLGARLGEALDEWSSRWLEARTQVCERRHAHREATALDAARAACLDAQLDDVDALAAVLREADTGALQNAERALMILPDPGLCVGDRPMIRRAQALRGGEGLLAELDELRWQVTVAEDRDLGARAAALVEEARALERSPEAGALLAEALLVEADVLALHGDSERAVDVLREATRAAERVSADNVRARAFVSLGFALATCPGRDGEALEVLEYAEALLERVGASRSEQVRLRRGLAEALLARGELARAVALADALVAELDKEGGDTFLLGSALLTRSRIAEAERDDEAALAYAARVVELYEDALGPDHPLSASPLTNMGVVETRLGRLDDARDSLSRSLGLRRAQHRDADSPGTRRRLAEVLVNLGNLESTAGREAEAADAYREALTLLPVDDAHTRALLLFNLGVSHQLSGRHEPALADYREALRLGEGVLAATHPRVVGARLGVGSMLVALGRFDEAREPLERALADWPEALLGGLDEAELRFALAQVLRALEGDDEGSLAQAKTLAGEARALYAASGAQVELAAVDAWLGE